MSSLCYWCQAGITGSLPNPISNATDPIGCCQNCHVFSCAKHAQRDAKRQHFKCYDCLFISLIASSVLSGNAAMNDLNTLTNLGLAFKDTYEQADIFESFKDFLLSYPEFTEWSKEIANTNLVFTNIPNNLLTSTLTLLYNFRSKQFLNTAALIIKKLEAENQPQGTATPLKTELLNAFNNQ